MIDRNVMQFLGLIVNYFKLIDEFPHFLFHTIYSSCQKSIYIPSHGGGLCGNCVTVSVAFLWDQVNL